MSEHRLRAIKLNAALLLVAIADVAFLAYRWPT